MLVFWQARLALLAVPKTGTTALEAALAPVADAAVLNPPGLKHSGIRKWHREWAPIFEAQGRRFETVACLREPVSWLGSWWRYRARPDLDGKANSTAGVGFDAFCADWLSAAPPPHARIGEQARFVGWADGAARVDHLFRHDRMDALVAFLEERLNRSIALERHNVSPAGPVEPSEATRARLRAERPDEFAAWESLP